MKKGFLLVLLMVFVAWGTAFAQDGPDIDIHLSCPTSASYGSGTNKLNVTAYIENWDCDDINLNRYMSGMITGSGTDQMGTIGVYGPFPRWAGSFTVPAASCPQGWPESPGTTSKSLFVMNVPNAPGKLATAFLSFITNNGEEIGGNACLVAITP